MTPAQLEAEEQYRRELTETLKAIHYSGVPVWFLEREMNKLKRERAAKEKMEVKAKARAKKAKEEEAMRVAQIQTR